MTFPEALSQVRYLTDPTGEKTDVLVPLSTWETLLASWAQLVDTLEDQEDRAILRDWLEKRASGQAATVTLDELEQELYRCVCYNERSTAREWKARGGGS